MSPNISNLPQTRRLNGNLSSLALIAGVSSMALLAMTPTSFAADEEKDADNIAHYPGWSREVLTFLVEQRAVSAIGHETSDTDPGFAASQMDYALETYFLSQNLYQIEMMTNLDKLPETGATIIASWPKARGGSGFPARVFAYFSE